MSNTAIFIPARMQATRLPGKPLADINGKPMIVHVWERALQANIGDVYVACSEQEVASAITSQGGNAIMTDPNHPSGTDRIHEALGKTGKNYDIIVNLQGDLPTIDPTIIETAANLLQNSSADIGTLTTPITKEEEKTNPNVVKIAIAFEDNQKQGRALYFSRATIPHGPGDLYHHIGLYAYTNSALKKFVSLPQSPLEKREKLEQLRALENNMRINVAVIDTIPVGVDSQEDLEYVRTLLK